MNCENCERTQAQNALLARDSEYRAADLSHYRREIDRLMVLLFYATRAAGNRVVVPDISFLIPERFAPCIAFMEDSFSRQTIVWAVEPRETEKP